MIVGGGISGLAAAFFLRDRGLAVTVLEGSPRLGGKLAVSEVAGVAVDEGAEALLARRPEGTDLIGAVGLADQLVLPGTTAAGIWTRGRLRPLPKRQFMGVPADLDELQSSGILSDAGMARARDDLRLPPTPRDGDVPVASYVGARFGRELVDRLVDPLLGGVYAGRADELSFEATLGGLAQASRQHRSLAEAAASLLPAPGASGLPSVQARPVFTTLSGGLGALPPAVAAHSGATVRAGAMVRELARTVRPDGEGWRLTVGPTRAPEWLDADAVILAVPARPASRLLAGLPGAGAAAAALGEIDYASMAIVTLAYRADAFPARPQGSGYLVPAVDGRPVKAVTFSTVKWPHLRGLRPPHSPQTPTCGAKAAWTSSGARSAGSARKRCCSGMTVSSPASQRPTLPLPPGCAVRRPTSGSAGGAAGCRSTRSATPSGWRASAPGSPRSPGSRSAGRSTTGSAYRPASRPRGWRQIRCSRISDRATPGPPVSASGRCGTARHFPTDRQ